jgi:hypothetical protein
MKWHGPDWLRQSLERINAPILYRIRSIYLADTMVDDAVVDPLGHMTCLREIDLSRTYVTQNGLKRIQEMFPGAKILYEPPQRESAVIRSGDDRFQ